MDEVKSMTPQLEKLLVLHDRDTRLFRLTTELDRIPEEKSHLDQQEKQIFNAVEEAKAQAKKIELECKKLEMEVAAKQTLVRKYKGQLLEIKNNDQFHALQHEITAAETEIRKIEDVELNLMEQAEKFRVGLKEAEARLREETQRLSVQRKDLNLKTTVLEKQVTDLKAERTHLSSEIDEDILNRYERIFRSKNNQAVARISHGMCMGCHLKLTSQEIHNAQRGTELVTCTNCGRILYWMSE